MTVLFSKRVHTQCRRLFAFRSIGGSGILFPREDELVRQALACIGELGCTGRGRRPLCVEETLEPVFLLHVAGRDRLAGN